MNFSVDLMRKHVLDQILCTKHSVQTHHKVFLYHPFLNFSCLCFHFCNPNRLISYNSKGIYEDNARGIRSQRKTMASQERTKKCGLLFRFRVSSSIGALFHCRHSQLVPFVNIKFALEIPRLSFHFLIFEYISHFNNSTLDTIGTCRCYWCRRYGISQSVCVLVWKFTSYSVCAHDLEPQFVEEISTNFTWHVHCRSCHFCDRNISFLYLAH